MLFVDLIGYVPSARNPGGFGRALSLLLASGTTDDEEEEASVNTTADHKTHVIELENPATKCCRGSQA